MLECLLLAATLNLEFEKTYEEAPVITEKIQAEIDRIAEEGGGTLTFREGMYKTGALFFKPGVNLRLERGAIIIGSDNPDDYPDMITRIEGETCVYKPALINADRCDNFTISGKGVIDGHGYPTWVAFWEGRKTDPEFANKTLLRPRLLYVSNSKNVDISGVTFRNSKFWTTHYYRCENVTVHDCEIIAEVIDGVRGPSSDAIDIDNCRNFTVRKVTMNVNDDSVVVKGGKGPWADDYEKHPENGPTENVLVENCVFKSVCHSCLTLGSECPEAYNIVMRNCRMDGPGNLLHLKMRTDTPQHYSNVKVENCRGRVRNFVCVKAWRQYENYGDRTWQETMSYADNITVKGCMIDCDRENAVVRDDRVFRLEKLKFVDNVITTRE